MQGFGEYVASENTKSYTQMRQMPKTPSNYQSNTSSPGGYGNNSNYQSNTSSPGGYGNNSPSYARQDMCAPDNNSQQDTNMHENQENPYVSAFTKAPVPGLNVETNTSTSPEEEKKVVFPGMTIPLNPNIRTRIGCGLYQHNKVVIASKCGILRSHNKSANQQSLWLENAQKKYEPRSDDMVVGTVIMKMGEEYILDLGATKNARLSHIAFEGASSRNKPKIEVGGLIYARVNFVCKDMDTEVTCTSDYVKRDWITGENLFGELKGGYCFKTSLKHATRLLNENCLVLRCLANYVPFEIAVGQNGRIWINSELPLHTILITNAILNSEHMTDKMIIAMVATLFDAVDA